MTFFPCPTKQETTKRLDEGLVWRWGNVLRPVVLQRDGSGLLWLGWLALHIDGLALGLGLLLSPCVLLDSEDELFSAAGVADVLLSLLAVVFCAHMHNCGIYTSTRTLMRFSM